MDPVTVIAIALGGALGTVARYLLALALAPISGALPWGTVIINVAGSFVIGLFGTLTLVLIVALAIYSRSQDVKPSDEMRAAGR